MATEYAIATTYAAAAVATMPDAPDSAIGSGDLVKYWLSPTALPHYGKVVMTSLNTVCVVSWNGVMRRVRRDEAVLLVRASALSSV